MELKEIIEISRQKIIEAHNAFYAGHPDVAKSYLVETHNLLQLVSPEPDITELPDVETPLEGLRDQEHAAQDSLNFTQHMNRIERLTSQILLHIQAENYQKATQNLHSIRTHATAAQHQLDKFQSLKSQGGTSTEGFGL